MSLPHPPLLLITDRHQAGVPLNTVLASALKAGCRWVLLREKDLSRAERRDLFGPLVRLCREHRAIALVGADIDLATQVRADGVHLNREGDCLAARRVLGAEAIIGYSAHSQAEAESAAAAGADYVTMSPVFPSASKPGYGPALGLAALRAVTKRVLISVIALGGITPENAGDCLAAGAAGVATMGSVMRDQRPGAVVARLISALACAQRN